MFHLDYLSCALTVLATILLARKSWIGLLIATVNSLIVCAIALRTSQLGLIPANLFCICIYALSMRSWLYQQTRTNRDQALQDTVAEGLRTSPADQRGAAAGTALRKAPRVVFYVSSSTGRAMLSRTSARHCSMNTLRPTCQGSRPRSWRDRMYSTQGTFSRHSSPRLRGEANQLRSWEPQKTEPSTLIP